MAKKDTRTRAASTMRPRKKSAPSDEEERILQAATLHLIQQHGMYLVATSAREVSIRGMPVWIITVTLRYDKGDEGYVGDLLYDGEKFTFLTEQSVMDERVRKIAENPKRLRKWNEYRSTTLHPEEA